MSIPSASPPSLSRQIPMFRTSSQRRQSPAKSISLAMNDDPKIPTTASSSSKQEKEVTIAPQLTIASPSASDLRFDRLQLSDDEFEFKHKREFGRFFAREAVLDEEFWTAAWLRAESHWEDRPNMRYADSHKRQFANQEFTSLKGRCVSQYRHHSEKCTCIIAVKKEDPKVKHTVLSSIVGTLDLSIRHLLCGEKFPGDPTKSQVFSNFFYRTDKPKCGYVSNLCVAKYARRQGIASNMLQLAVDAAKSYGVCEIFVHVRKDNVAAQKLYDKLGFQMVEMDSSEEKNYLLCLKT